MKLCNCLKNLNIAKQCTGIIITIALVMLIAGWIMAASGCKRTRMDFSKSYYFCEEIGDQRMYYGGLFLILLGVKCFFGWVFSLLLLPKPKMIEYYEPTDPENEYSETNRDLNELENEPLNKIVDIEKQAEEETTVETPSI